MSGLSPVASGSGAVSDSVFHAGGGVKGVFVWWKLEDEWLTASAVALSRSAAARVLSAFSACSSFSSFSSLLPVRNENKPIVLTHERHDAVKSRDERVDVFRCVVHR